jgi:hypothetical protein
MGGVPTHDGLVNPHGAVGFGSVMDQQLPLLLDGL